MDKYAIDVRWMIGNVRGMGRYAQQLIAPIKDKCIGLAPRGIQKQDLPTISQGKSFFPYWEQIVMPKLAVERADVLICPYNTGPLIKPEGVKLVVVVHDLIFMRTLKELPASVSLYQTLGRFYRRLVVPRVLKQADILLTVSEFTKREIQERYNIGKDICVIPNAISSHWLEEKRLLIADRGNYIFTVAGEAPSKNVVRLIKAFSLAKKSLPTNMALKIAGIKPEHHAGFIKEAIACGVESSIDFLGFISESELKKLYRQARLFVFASLFEGFGIPLIEAMASGTPICCSNSTSLPEVIGECGILFDPLKIHEIAEAMTCLALDDDKSERLINEGRKRVKLYTEDRVNNLFAQFWEATNAK